MANIILAFVTPNCSMSFQELLMIHRQGIILFLRCLVLSALASPRKEEFSIGGKNEKNE